MTAIGHMRTSGHLFARLTLFALAAAFALPSAAALQTNVVDRSYDRFGRLVGLSVDGERRMEIAYDDATGRVASMCVAGEDEPFRWEYEPGSELKRTLRYPNGAKVTWEYEPRRDFVTLVSNDVYSSFRYAYDAAGRRVSKNDERYEYNKRGELTLATNAATDAEFAYRYDDIGNRLWSRELGTNCTYAANELNQYTNVVRGGVSERSAFDIDGNQTNIVTSTGEWAVEYNGENRPVRWTRESDGATVLMAFDRMGRRVRKNEEMFIYNGYLNVSQTVWDPTEPVATRPLVWRGSDGSGLYCHDGNKNVSDVIADDGSLAAHYGYAPFGAIVASYVVLASENRYSFSSEYYDESIGVSYYNYRFYCSLHGNWTVRDRIEESDSLRLYGFTGNSPVFWIDSLGESMSVSACNAAVANAEFGSPKVAEMLEVLRKRNCPSPKPACKCCVDESGSFSPTTKTISICANNSEDGGYVIETLAHELIHALDDCLGANWFDCGQRACSEIRAVNYEGSCRRNGGAFRKMGQSYKECVKEAASESVEADAKCKPGREIVDKMFKKCFYGDLP